MTKANAGVSRGHALRAWATLLILSSILPGFVLGASLGAQLLVPKDAGLAGGAMVFWYGMLGVLLGIGGAWLTVRRMPPDRVKPAALIAAAMALATLTVLIMLFRTEANEQAAQQVASPTRLSSGHAPAAVRG